MFIKLPRDIRNGSGRLHPGSRNQVGSGWTLVEMMVAVAIFGISAAAMTSLYWFGITSFCSLTNYAALDAANRLAMDSMTSEIRGAQQVINYSTNPASITFVNQSNITVSYTFTANNTQLTRNDGIETAVLLTNCDLLAFHLFSRCPYNGVWGSFPIATNSWSNTVQVLQFTWKTAMSLPQGVVDSEDVQTAYIIIRNSNRMQYAN